MSPGASMTAAHPTALSKGLVRLDSPPTSVPPPTRVGLYRPASTP